MVTSAEFDKVLVPVDYQNNVLMRTFDTLVGFNKKNKKGKFMKSIKEEWENGKWVEKTTAQKEAEARHKALQNKIDAGDMKIISLDKKKSEPKTDKEKKAASSKELYKGTLLNKVGKTEGQITKEVRQQVAAPRAIKGTAIVDPGDTHYSIKEIAEYAFNHSAKIRAKFTSSHALEQKLAQNEKLRKDLDEKMIAKIVHPEEKKRTPREKKDVVVKEKVTLETDPEKITDWFWAKKGQNSFKILFPDITDRRTLYRTIINDDRGLKFFAKIMKNNGYKKEAEKPFVSKVTVIKKEKPEAAKDFENTNDKTFKTVLPFLTSWAKEHGIKLSQEAIDAFKEQVFKTIVYHNTMGILHGDK